VIREQQLTTVAQTVVARQQADMRSTDEKQQLEQQLEQQLQLLQHMGNDRGSRKPFPLWLAGEERQQQREQQREQGGWRI
jgi:hypothetical protein